MSWSEIKPEVARIMRYDLRRIRARIAGLGRDDGRDPVERTRLLIDLELAACITRQCIDQVGAR